MLSENTVRSLLLEKKYILGPHALARIVESGINNVAEVIAKLARDGAASACSPPH